MKKTAILALCFGTLAGCAAPVPVDPGPYPANYKALIAQSVRASFFDPSSLEDVGITKPEKGTLGFNSGWLVCLRANGKNRNGAYAGQQIYGYLIQNGVITDNQQLDACPVDDFTEWKEMENAGWNSTK